MGKLEFCGVCPHRKRIHRLDYYPPGGYFYCTHPDVEAAEIGFLDRKPDWCPLGKHIELKSPTDKL